MLLLLTAAAAAVVTVVAAVATVVASVIVVVAAVVVTSTGTFAFAVTYSAVVSATLAYFRHPYKSMSFPVVRRVLLLVVVVEDGGACFCFLMGSSIPKIVFFRVRNSNSSKICITASWFGSERSSSSSLKSTGTSVMMVAKRLDKNACSLLASTFSFCLPLSLSVFS